MKAGEIFELENINKTFSHAYLLVGRNQTKIDSLIERFIEIKGCLPEDLSVLKSNQGVSGKEGEIKIDDVRALIHNINLSPHGTCRIAIIYNAEKLNQSSGNILLKTLEEPPKNLTIIIVSSNENVLPTIKSRCRILKVGSKKTLESSGLEKIFSKNFFEVSAHIEQIIKDEKTKLLIEDLIIFLRQKMLISKNPKTALAIKKVITAQKHIDQNANPKLALESLFLKVRAEFND